MLLVIAGVVLLAIVILMAPKKSHAELLEEVVSLLHDDETKAEWTEADRQSTRDYYKSNSASELRCIAYDIKRAARR